MTDEPPHPLSQPGDTFNQWWVWGGEGQHGSGLFLGKLRHSGTGEQQQESEELHHRLQRGGGGGVGCFPGQNRFPAVGWMQDSDTVPNRTTAKPILQMTQLSPSSTIGFYFCFLVDCLLNLWEQKILQISLNPTSSPSGAIFRTDRKEPRDHLIIRTLALASWRCSLGFKAFIGTFIGWYEGIGGGGSLEDN